MRRVLSAGVVVVAASLCALAAVAAPDVRNPAGDWREYTHPRLGYRITYPADTFVPVESRAEEGFVLASRDGKAKLLIASFDNDGLSSLAEYRNLVINQSYDGAAIDYAPVRRNWFVVSGERDGQMFYERVDFTCGGRRITSWAMVYPVAERGFYDRLVEAIAPTFRPSDGARAGC